MKWLYSLFSIILLFLIFDPAPVAHTAPIISVEMITAHRGSSYLAPENTISAIQLAIEEKAGFTEIDVRLTADGTVVLSHDDSLYRTARLQTLVSKSTYQELLHADVGARFGEQYTGEHIPTLEEVMSLARGKIKLNIEIKMDPFQAELPYKVAQLIQEHDYIDHCVVTSFDRTALQIVKEVEPSIQTGLIVGSMQRLTTDVIRDEGIDILSLRSSLVNRHIVEQARAHSKLVYVWTVDKPQEMRRMAQYGVDSIITNKPQLLFNILF